MNTKTTLLLLFTGIIFQFDGLAQQCNGTIKLNIIQDKSYFVWNEGFLKSQDTTIHFSLNKYQKRPIYGSIPQGQYTLTLFSEFNDRLERQLTVTKNTTQKINAKDYYSLDPDTSTFLSKLQNGDTLKIFVIESGCFHIKKGYCRITFKDDAYFIHFKTLHESINHQLSLNELEKIKHIEAFGRNRKKSYQVQPQLHNTGSLLAEN